MTFIAPDGHRTLRNGSVYNRRKVYEATCHALLDEVQSVYGTGEVRKTGRVVPEQIVYHLVATSEEFARALFQKHYGSEFQRHTLISLRPLFVIDGEISTGYN